MGVAFLWYPWKFEMLGGSEFRLRQGFACGKTLVRRKCAAPLCGAPASVCIFFVNTKHKNNHTCRVWLFLWYPWAFAMLGGSTRKGCATSVRRQSRRRLCSEFRLCQDFACGETLVQRKRAAPPRGALSHVRIFPANPRQKATPTGVAFSLRHKLPHTALPPAEPHHSAGGTAARVAACRARAFSRSWKSPRARRSTWEASAPKPGCSAHWARVAG